MDKKKASPRKPPIEDLQGHSYQHELGDPDRAEQIENRISKVRRSPVRPERDASKTGDKPVVVVTGSAGLIGAKVVEAFASDYQVVGLDLKAPKKGPASAGFVECDLTEDKSVQDAFAKIRRLYGQRLASIIHLAAYYDFSGEPSEMYEQLTVNGTLRLFRELKQFDVEQFVFSSTILVMEPAHEDEVLTESSPLEHEPWDYPRSKIKTERLIRLERGEIPAVILRIAGVYDETGHAVPIAQQISRIYQKQFESHFFPGNASHGQAFVHMDDLVDCFRRVVERRGALNSMEVLLIAEPDLMSYEELQNEIGRQLYGEEWTTVWIPKLMAKAGAWAKGLVGGPEETFIKPWMIDLADDHYPVSIKHAREKLGWQPVHHLRTTLPEIINGLKRDPVGWFKANKLGLPKGLKKKTTHERRAA